MTDAIGRADYQLGARLDQLQRDLQQAKSLLKKEGEAAEREANAQAERAVSNLSRMSELAARTITGSMALLGGAVGIAGRSIVGTGDAMAYLAARTGKSREELDGYEARLQALHRANYGEDQRDIADAIAQVEVNLGTAGEATDDVVRKGLALRDTFGVDIPQQMRGAQNLITNFGISGAQAMDLITAGLQQGGEGAEDLLDTFDEYSSSFRDMGYDAEAFLDVLLTGLEQGARNSDQVADAIKEVDIRMRDGSKATREALQGLGIDWRRFEEDLGSGAVTGAEAIGLINRRLRAVGDTTRQEQLGVALWGTKWEDAGADVILSLDQVDGKVKDLEGSADRLDAAIYSGPTSAFEAWRREIQGTVTDITNKLVPGIRELAPILAGFGPFLAPALATLGGFLGDRIGKAMVPKIAAALTAATAAGGALTLAAAAAPLAIPVALILNKDAVDDFIETLTQDLARALGGSGTLPMTLDRPKPGPVDGGNMAANQAGADAIIARRQRERAAADQAAYLAGWNEAWGRRPIDWSVVMGGADAMTAAFKSGEATGREYVIGVFGGLYATNVPGDPGVANAINQLWRSGDRGAAMLRGRADGEGYGSGAMMALAEPGFLKTLVTHQQQQGIEANRAFMGGLATILPGAGQAASRALAQQTIDAAEAAEREAAEAGRATARALWSDLVVGLRSGQKPVKAAMADLRWALENPLEGARLRARIEGALTGEQLAKGLQSRRPWVREQAERAKAELIRQWELASGRSWDHGLSIQENLAGGMRRGRNKPVTEARVTAEATERPFRGLKDSMWTWGNRSGLAWAQGLSASQQAAINAGAGVVKAVGGVFRASSPPTHPLNPMRDIVTWGRRTVEAYADGMRQGVPSVMGVLGGELGGMFAGGSLRVEAPAPTVTHEHRGAVRVELSGATIAAARGQGASWEDVGRMASAANLAPVLLAARADAETTYRTPRRI